MRIGIYAGTFDPVHAGHIGFALQSMKAANLDKLYFLPERQPRGKKGVEHFGHRTAMLERALKPYRKFGVIELVDTNFSVARTLPQLQQQFPDSQLVFLFGSDIVSNLANWPNVKQLLKSSELVIGLREQDDENALRQTLANWKVRPKALTMFKSHAPKVSSGKIREALRLRQKTPGSLKSVEHYSDQHWLYISLQD
ncbi:MAG TPA: nicotinate-nicotinamide nucleotide adenylyltransferase [Candidatus Saccharimonadales bacterium]|nr:nicotinate-nicotinamide nucleotide adenylyltransferase [Candidatus Saccharimonadales bacterium]